MKPTDIPQLLSALGSGVFEDKLAVVVSTVAAAVLREATLSVAANLNRADVIQVKVRLLGYQTLRCLIAREFAATLGMALDTPPVIGTIRPA